MDPAKPRQPQFPQATKPNMKTKTLGDGIEIDVETEIAVLTVGETTLKSAQVHGSNEITHFLESADGKTETLDHDNMVDAAALLGMTADELRSNLWP